MPVILRLQGAIAAACVLFASAGFAQGQGPVALVQPGRLQAHHAGRKVILIDPWIIGGMLTPPDLNDLGKVGKVDLLLVIHGHGDRLGDAMLDGTPAEFNAAPGQTTVQVIDAKQGEKKEF